MLRFVEAGFIAGARQLLAVILITWAVLLAVSEKVVAENAAFPVDSHASAAAVTSRNAQFS